MVKGGDGAENLVIVSQGAGSVTDAVVAKLRAAFPDHRFVDFPAEKEVLENLAGGTGTVVACGGDGTIEAVARALAGSKRPFGIIAMGTFNNFARSLQLPTDVDRAIEVVKTGSPRPCTLGCVNGKEFLEAAAIGFFGDTIALGEAAKELQFGELAEKLSSLARAKSFRFRTEGDVALRGEAISIIVANTPSIGALVPVGGGSPVAAHLELVVHRSRSRLALVGSLLKALIGRRRTADFERHPIRRLRIITVPSLTVYADVSEAGRTPAAIEALPGGLMVILPS